MTKKLIRVFALFIADELGNFDWIYTAPKGYYYTREEAEKVREELIKAKEKVTKSNTKVKCLWKVEDSKEQLKN